MRKFAGLSLWVLPVMVAFLSVAALYLDTCDCAAPDEWEFLTWFWQKAWMVVALGAAAGLVLGAVWKLVRWKAGVVFDIGVARLAYIGACAGVVETVRYVFEWRSRYGGLG